MICRHTYVYVRTYPDDTCTTLRFVLGCSFPCFQEFVEWKLEIEREHKASWSSWIATCDRNRLLGEIVASNPHCLNFKCSSTQRINVWYTPWKFNIAPENIASQKEKLPTIIFQGRTVKLRGCIWTVLSKPWFTVGKQSSLFCILSWEPKGTPQCQPPSQEIRPY